MDHSDQTSTFRFDDSILHLGPTSSTVVREFSWEHIGDHAAHFAADGAQGRLVTMARQTYVHQPGDTPLAVTLEGIAGPRARARET